MKELINLAELKNVDICTVEKDSLVDIDSVLINPNLDKNERLQEYVRQIKNPFCFVCNGIIVKTNFSISEESLESRLSSYFSSIR